jgi:glutaredoxin
MATTIIIYGKENCSYCLAACRFLESKHLAYQYIDTTNNPKALDAMQTATQGRGKTFPQIIINEKPIGGFSDMMALVNNHEFESLLTGDSVISAESNRNH